MSVIRLTLVWVLLVVTALDLSNGNVCEDGLSGRFCSKDLSGWYECKGEGLGAMVQTEHECREGTRCACFSGSACDSALQDPCGELIDPPVFPAIFTLFYNEKVNSCDSQNCVITYASGDEVQNANKGKLRTDRTTTYYESNFILRKNESSGYDTFDAHWDQTKCTKGSRDTFPRFRVPADFTYNGKVVKDGVTCDKWFRQGDGTVVIGEVWYTRKNEKGDDVPWEYFTNGFESNTMMNYTKNIAFPTFTEMVDEEKFMLPNFCDT